MKMITERWLYKGNTLFVYYHNHAQLGVFKLKPMCIDGNYFFDKPFSMPMSPHINANKDDVMVVTFTKHDNPVLEITKQPYF